MNIIKSYKGIQVRWIKQNDDSIWAVAKDICDILGLDNVSQSLTAIDEENKNDINIKDPVGQTRTYKIISEPGIYELIFKSIKPEAKAFKKWVFSEVLPAIRKTGGYTLSEEKQELIQFMRAVEKQEAIEMQYMEAPPGWDTMTEEDQKYEEERLQSYCDEDGIKKALNEDEDEDVYNPKFDSNFNVYEHPTYQTHKNFYPGTLPNINQY